jgi:hypothetical protein
MVRFLGGRINGTLTLYNLSTGTFNVFGDKPGELFLAFFRWVQSIGFYYAKMTASY